MNAFDLAAMKKKSYQLPVVFYYPFGPPGSCWRDFRLGDVMVGFGEL